MSDAPAKPPRRLLLTDDLAAGSRIVAAGRAVGAPVVTLLSATKLQERAAEVRPRLVLLDLAMPGLALQTLVPALRSAAPEATIIAFGPHVQEARLAAAEAAGCDRVLTRGQLHRMADDLLAEFADDAPAGPAADASPAEA